MRTWFCRLCLLLLAGCSDLPKNSPASGWQPSALSDQVIEQANQASREYFACIQERLSRYRYRGGNSRYETQALLRHCEHHLKSIRQAFSAEGVDAKITERYLKRKRTQAARYVLETIMGLEAQHRAAQAGG
ncbi:MAG: hypothetical protein N3A55_10305 [Methylohalobius sp.]|nr:hypothetical protein [Methylohalobius sp.]